MPRALKDEKLDTPTARARLAPRRKPHYRLIERGLHVGYYRGDVGGSWIARRYLGAGTYATQRLGLADDGREANGRTVLSFSQAQKAAREWATMAERKDSGIEEATPWTVAQAVEHYLADYSARGGKARRYVEITFAAHVLPRLGERKIADLTPNLLRAWHRGLATAPARLRTAATATKQHLRATAAEPDEQRSRRATANRILTDLKAALNLAYREGKAPTDDAWRRVQPFKGVQTAKVRYLSNDESSRLVTACPPDLRKLVTAALLTGCRYQELATLRPGDIDLAAGMLTVRAAKGGSARAVVLTAEAQQFFRESMADKSKAALLIERDGTLKQATRDAPAEMARVAWGKSDQFRPLRVACQAAGIVPAISFHILRHTHASRLAMAGVPLAVIAAQLGHSDTKITAKHYAHLSPGYVADTIRAAFGTLGLFAAATINPMQIED